MKFSETKEGERLVKRWMSKFDQRVFGKKAALRIKFQEHYLDVLNSIDDSFKAGQEQAKEIFKINNKETIEKI